MFDVRHLRMLRELSHRATMTAVGEALGLTASAVSQQLTALEHAAGVPLLDRIGRRVILTDAGVRLVAHAEKVMAAIEEAEQDILGAVGAPRGDLVVATFASFARLRILPAVQRIRQRHPQLRVTLHELETPDALEAVRDGRCHIAIVFTYNLVPHPGTANFTSTPLVDEPVMLVQPPSRPRNRAAVDVRGLKDAEWIVGSRQSDDRILVERVCASAGFAPRIRHAVDDYSLVLGMVAAGLGVGFVPEMGLEGASNRRIQAHTISGPSVRRLISAVTRPLVAGSANVKALIRELRA